MDQVPSVGRIVHFVEAGACRAAIVTDTRDDESIDAVVFSPAGLGYERNAPHADSSDDPAEREGGTWHWPERV